MSPDPGPGDGTLPSSAIVQPPSRDCANCHTALQGPFCFECGQRSIARPNSLAAFLAAALSDVLNFRSRTLRRLFDLVFRPGEVTASFMSGRRVRYTQPVHLYLIAAAVFFLANSFDPFVAITADNQVVSSLGLMSTEPTYADEEIETLEASGLTMEVFRERFQSAVGQSLPPFMIGSILLFALMLSLFSPKRPALMHIVFSLHWTGFYLFIMALERLVPGAPGATSVLGPILVIAAATHLVLALRRAYGHGWPRAVASGFALTLLFNVILEVWVFAVIQWAQRQSVNGG